MEKEEQLVFELIKRKCQELKITQYGGAEKMGEDHLQERLVGALIAYYETGLEMRELAIAEIINSSENKGTSRISYEESMTRAKQVIDHQKVESENQSFSQSPSKQQQILQASSTLTKILQRQCQKLKISIDSSYDNFKFEKKPYLALSGLVAYYESEIEFKDQALKELIQKEDFKSERMLEKKMEIKIEQGMMEQVQRSQEREKEQGIEEIALDIEETKDRLLAEEMEAAIKHQQGVHIPKHVWEELVKTINENNFLRQLNLSVLPQNFNQTFNQMINHYQSYISKADLAFQQLANENKSLLTLISQQQKKAPQIIIQREQQRQREYQNQIESLQHDLQRVRVQIRQLTEENSMFKGKLNDMKLELVSEQSKWNEEKEIKTREIEALNLTNSKLKQDMEESNNKLKEQIDILTQTYSQQITKLQNELKDKSADINFFTQQSQQKALQQKDQSQKLQRQISQLVNDKIEMKKKHEIDLDSMSNALIKAKESSQFKGQELERVNQLLVNITKSGDDKAMEINALKEQNQRLTSLIYELKNQVNQAEIKSRKQIQDNNQSNEIQIKQLTTKLQSIIKQKDDKIKELEDKSKPIQNELIHYKDSLGKQNKQRLQSQARLKQSQKLIASKDQQLTKMTSQNTQIKTKLTQCEQQLSELTKKLSQEQQKNRQHMEQSEHLKHDIEEISMEKERLGGELKRVQQEKQNEVELLKKEIEEKEYKIQWLTISIEDLQRQLEKKNQKMTKEVKIEQKTEMEEGTSTPIQEQIQPQEPLGEQKLALSLHPDTQLHPSHESHISQKDLRSDIHTMEEQFAKRERNLSEQKKNLEQQYHRLNQQLQIEQALKSQLETNLKSLKQEHNKVQDKLQQNKIHYQNLVNNLNETIEFLRKQIKQKEEIIHQRSPTRITPPLQYASNQLGYDVIKVDEVKEEVNTSELEKTYQQEIKTHQDKLQHFNNQLSVKEQKITSLQNNNTQLAQQITQLQSTLTTISQQLAQSQKRQQQQQQVLATLQDIRGDQQLKIQQLTQNIERKQIELKSEKECFVLKEKSLNQQIKKNEKQINDLKQDCKKAEGKIVMLQNIEREKVQLDKKYEKLKIQVEQQNKQLTEKTQTINKLTAQLQKLKQQQEQINATTQVLTQYNALKRKSQQDSKALTQLQTKFDKQSITIDHLSQDNINKINKIKKLQNQLMKKQNQLQNQIKQTLNAKKINQKSSILHKSLKKILDKYGVNIKQLSKFTIQLKQRLNEIYQRQAENEKEFQKDVEEMKKLSKQLEEQVKRVVIKPQNEPMQIQEQEINEASVKREIEKKKQLLTFYDFKFLHFWKKSEEQQELLKQAEENRKELDIQRINNTKMEEEIKKLQAKISEMQQKTVDYGYLLEQLKAKNNQIQQLEKEKIEISHQLTQVRLTLQKAKGSIHEKQQELKVKKKYNDELNDNIKKILHEKSQIQQQLPLLIQENNELKKKNEHLKLSDQQKEKQMKEKFELDFHQYKNQVETKLKADNAKIMEKFHHDKQTSQSQITTLQKYINRLKSIVKKIFDRSQEKIEIKTNSIEEWIYQAEKLVEDEKRKIGCNLKYQKKNDDFLKRLGKISY